MKIKLLLPLMMLTSIKMQAMEEPNIEDLLKEIPLLRNTLKDTPTEEFIEAYKLVSKQGVPMLKSIATIALPKGENTIDSLVPEELKYYIDKIKLLTRQIDAILKCNRISLLEFLEKKRLGQPLYENYFKEEKEILLNIINNQEFDLHKHYPLFVNNYPTAPNIDFRTMFLNIILIKSINYKKPELVKLALNLGAKAEAEVENGYSYDIPLIEAVRMENEEIIQLLLNAGAATDALNIYQEAMKDYTLASDNKKKIVKILIDAGFDVNAKYNLHEQTPLIAASEKGL